MRRKTSIANNRARPPIARALTCLLACWLAACAGPDTRPTNEPFKLTTGSVAKAAASEQPGDAAIVVAFSGGGARSAAFGYGVLSQLARTPSPMKGRSLADEVSVVAGVSGGAILASYFALHGVEGLPGFQYDFLERNAEKSLRMDVNITNFLRGYQGGINDRNALPPWLDENLFHGATLGMLDRPNHPRLVIHATDLYNRAPFIFDRASFAAICSDFDNYPLSYAVAASAAVPVAFAPITLRNYRSDCPSDELPPKALLAKSPPRSNSLLERQYRESLDRYRSADDLNFLKLYDGGMVDGIGSLSLMHLMNRGAPEPLPAAKARKVRQILFIMVDASTRIGGDISERADAPNAKDTIVAATDALTNIPNLQGYDDLSRHLPAWRDELIRWRCNASQPDASCQNLEVTIIRVALSEITDQPRASRILSLHNTLKLEPGDSTFLSDLGGDLLVQQPGYHRFLARIAASTRKERL